MCRGVRWDWNKTIKHCQWQTQLQYYPIMNLTHSNQTVYVLLAGYQYSYYTVTIILGSQDITLWLVCLKWRRHDCDMLSIAIALYGISHTIPSTHVCHNLNTQNISLPVKQSHLLSYDPDQTAHGHTLHATGARKLCPVCITYRHR